MAIAISDVEPGVRRRSGQVAASGGAGRQRDSAVPVSPELSVVVPTYRDGATIVASLARLEAALHATGLAWEVVVVVDGDRETYEHAVTCSSAQIHVHGYEQNRGKGFALRYGMYKSRGGLVTFIDSDMEIAPEEIGRMAKLLALYQADVVVGSKRHPLSQVQYPALRRFQSICLQLLIRSLFRVRVRDTQTGLKMMRREVAERVIRVALVKRFAFDLELLAIARLFGYTRVIEAPVSIAYSFASTADVRAVLAVLWDTGAIFYRLHVRHWYQRRDVGGEGHGVAALISALPSTIVL